MVKLQVWQSAAAAIGVVARNPHAFLLTQGLVLLPMALVTLVLILQTVPPVVTVSLDQMAEMARWIRAESLEVDLDFVTDGGLMGRVAWMISMLLGVGLGVIVAGQRLAGERVGIGTTLRQFLARMLPLVAATVLAFVLPLLIFLLSLPYTKGGSTPEELLGRVILFTLAWTILGAYFYCRYVVLVPVVVLERLGPLESLRRASALTKGNRWRILGLSCLVLFLTSLGAFVLLFPLTLAGLLPPSSITVGSDATGTFTILRSQILARWAFDGLIGAFLAFLFSAGSVAAYRQLIVGSPAASPASSIEGAEIDAELDAALAVKDESASRKEIGPELEPEPTLAPEPKSKQEPEP